MKSKEYEFEKFNKIYPRIYDRLELLNDTLDIYIKENKIWGEIKHLLYHLALNTIGKSKKELIEILNKFIFSIEKNNKVKITVPEIYNQFIITNNLGDFDIQEKIKTAIHESGHALISMENKTGINLLTLIPQFNNNYDDDSLIKNIKRDFKNTPFIYQR